MITKIKWHNHKALGNLELDFQKSDGTPYNTIVLAGENGTGKTTILETLATFIGGGSFVPFEYIEYVVGNETLLISKGDKEEDEYGYHKRINEKDGHPMVVRCNKNNNPQKIDNDPQDIRHYGILYNRAQSGFKTKSIKSSTTQQLDSGKYDIDEKEDFTHIKQLIIDIGEDDNQIWMEQTIKAISRGVNPNFETFRKNSKLARFKDAFNNFFETIEFSEVKTAYNEKNVYFSRYGKSLKIDDLSTGEKQIVFRGAQLLRNSGNMSDGVVLVDEPELSMHPKWQAKILKYYRDLFTKNGKQLTQMIFATHSEAVLKSALEDKDNVLVIVLKDRTGTIDKEKITAPFVLPVITSAETNYRAFDVVSNDYHIELYGYLQNKTNNHQVDSCDNYIKTQPEYDVTKHKKADSYNGRTYETLPTYIRNAIDHPDSGRKFTQDELRCSIELLIELCK